MQVAVITSNRKRRVAFPRAPVFPCARFRCKSACSTDPLSVQRRLMDHFNYLVTSDILSPAHAENAFNLNLELAECRQGWCCFGGVGSSTHPGATYGTSLLNASLRLTFVLLLAARLLHYTAARTYDAQHMTGRALLLGGRGKPQRGLVGESPPLVALWRGEGCRRGGGDRRGENDVLAWPTSLSLGRVWAVWHRNLQKSRLHKRAQ